MCLIGQNTSLCPRNAARRRGRDIYCSKVSHDDIHITKTTFHALFFDLKYCIHAPSGTQVKSILHIPPLQIDYQEKLSVPKDQIL
jgi:hypothetical protein